MARVDFSGDIVTSYQQYRDCDQFPEHRAAMSYGSIKLGLIFMLVTGLCGTSVGAIAKDVPRKNAQRVQSNEPAIVIARIWKDGSPCVGMARLRPLKNGQMDMSRFVNVGYVTAADTKPQLQAMGEFFAKGITLDIKGLMADMNKELKDQFVQIEPGSYVMTNITCTHGNRRTWIGSDRSNIFAAESGSATPIKGANVIDVRPGEILHAGVIEIRSDEVGFFQTKTGYVAASPAPEEEQAQLRELFQASGQKLRFSTFRPGVQ